VIAILPCPGKAALEARATNQGITEPVDEMEEPRGSVWSFRDESAAPLLTSARRRDKLRFSSSWAMAVAPSHPEMQSASALPIGFPEGWPGKCHRFVVKSLHPLRIVLHLKAVDDCGNLVPPMEPT